MTGPEHYREAERLLSAARTDIACGQLQGNLMEHDTQVARAQVHATLALVAAQAGATLGMPGVPSAEWSKALS